MAKEIRSWRLRPDFLTALKNAPALDTTFLMGTLPQQKCCVIYGA